MNEINQIKLGNTIYQIRDSVLTEEVSSIQEDSQRMQEAITQLQDKVNYEAPQITSFTMSPSTMTYEKGTVIPTLTLNWVLNKAVSSQVLNGVTVAVGTTTMEFENVLSDTSYTLVVSDDKNSASKTLSVKFLNRKFYGVSAVPSTYDSTFIQSLSSGTLTSSRNGSFTVNAGADQYIFFAIPTSFGTPTFSVGGFTGGFVKVAAIQFTNTSGYTSEYTIYKSEQPNLGSTTVVVS